MAAPTTGPSIGADSSSSSLKQLGRRASLPLDRYGGQPPPLDEVFALSVRNALSGGLSGAAAMGVNVVCFMWLRTVMSVQQVHGTRMIPAIHLLYQEGGLPRFYRGFLAALIQAPACRFGDTAANAFTFTVLDSYPETSALPVSAKTAVASVGSSMWRLFLMPLDTVRTFQMVEGARGLQLLHQKVMSKGVGTLYHGGLAAFFANLLGHFPWFFTYNYLDQAMEMPVDLKARLMRNAFIGFMASVASDTISNSLSVIKIYKQASSENLSYKDAAQRIFQRDGMTGLLGRGLGLKLLGNGLQGMTFGVLWRLMDDYIFEATTTTNAS